VGAIPFRAAARSARKGLFMERRAFLGAIASPALIGLPAVSPMGENLDEFEQLIRLFTMFAKPGQEMSLYRNGRRIEARKHEPLHVTNRLLLRKGGAA
jgi:hypothetical protein